MFSVAREFNMPSQVITGLNALDKAGTYLQKFGSKALIVSDSMMDKLNNVDKVIDILEKNNIDYSLCLDIDGEPTDQMIENGSQLYEKNGCDFLIAIGGGSPIDAMKAIGVVVSNKRSINSFAGETINTQTPFMVAIPTTAGTGSEATQFTIITDTQNDVKMLLKGPVLLPTLAIVDPQFTLSAPPNITAATGLDALCHAIEAYTSKKAQPLSQSFSISAVKKIVKYLPRVYDDGNDLEAREQMAMASLEAGIAFNNASVTIVHGMSRPIGALYHVPHGLSNAMLMNVCFSYAMQGATKAFAYLAKECAFAKWEDSDEMAAKILLGKICSLLKHCQVMTLAEFGVNKEDFFSHIPKMAKDAIDSGSPANTIRTCTIEDIEQLYASLWD